MPKLHFYDTGLACWLLGIRSAEQLRSHPLRGALFETWVVSEILEHRMNRGERLGLSHYRDRNGAEVDLVVKRSNRVTLVEAKASQTASTSLFDGVRRVRGHLLQATLQCDVLVGYGGTETQSRSEGSLVSWLDLHTRDWVG